MPIVPAYYGRTAHAAGTSDSQADRYRQLALCRAVAAGCGVWVTAEFFDEDCRAGFPWQDRPQGPVPARRAAVPRPSRRGSSGRGPVAPAKTVTVKAR